MTKTQQNGSPRLRLRKKSRHNTKLRRIISVVRPRIKPAGGMPLAKEAKPFWQWAVELGHSIPKHKWDKVPVDLGKNLDHYLYGAPKVKE
jgi:hypothetical protein